MPEITANDEDDVAAFLDKTFSIDDRGVARDFASIAVFLSTAGQWQQGIAFVSEMLADQYQAEVLRSRGNRLTNAISAAAAFMGFSPYTNGVILAGFTAEETFKDYVKNQAFWKDAVSSNHGEHSHSLQWLAVGEAVRRGGLKLTYGLPWLYTQTIRYKSNTSFFHSGRGADAEIYLWDFLVDCFDFGAQAPDWQTNIRTATARSPTVVNKYVYKNSDTLWIGSYLKLRYDNRGWGAPGDGKSIKEHAIAKAKERGFKQTATNSGGNAVYERPAVTKGLKTMDIPGTRQATLVISGGGAWGKPGPLTAAVKWKTKAGQTVLLDVEGAIPASCSSKGEHQVEVSVAQFNGVYRATIVKPTA